jgi:cysteine-rich repeat protein
MRLEAALVLGGMLAACSGSSASGGDADAGDANDGGAESTGEDDGSTVPPDGDGGREDATPDGPRDWGDVEWIDGSIPELPYVADCGNGILDDGEECDDGNRLNGDGCDWLCRIGDGEPPPPPDPGISDYLPSGEPTTLPDSRFPGSSRVPLVWTGEEYATAMCEDLTPGDGGDDAWQVRFRRFDSTGRSLDADWLYPGPHQYSDVELVWNGNGFGLFYNDAGWGIVFLRLDFDGKPMGEPRLIEADDRVLSLAADWDGTQFGLGWTSRGDGSARGACSIGAPNPVRLALVGVDGTTDGFPGPVVVDTAAGYDIDVAAGDGGFGLMFNALVPGGEVWRCGERFLRVSSDLATTTPSGLLTDYGWGWQVVWDGEAYVAAYLDMTFGHTTTGGDLCVSRLSAAGEWEAAPVCTSASRWGMGDVMEVRLAAGDGGLVLVFSVSPRNPIYAVRADLHGTPAAEPHAVFDCPAGDGTCAGHFATVWASDGFGVIYQDLANNIVLRTFVAAE